MPQELFDKLLEMVHLMISKQDTIMRPSIDTRTCLDVTLRYLATGSSMADLHYEFNIGAWL